MLNLSCTHLLHAGVWLHLHPWPHHHPAWLTLGSLGAGLLLVQPLFKLRHL